MSTSPTPPGKHPHFDDRGTLDWHTLFAEALMDTLRELAQKIIDLSPQIPAEASFLVRSIDEPGVLADIVASNLNIQPDEKQELLETFPTHERMQKVIALLNKEIQVLELSNKIQTEVKGEMDKAQREYFLREQLKAIQKELGEVDERQEEFEELKAVLAARYLCNFSVFRSVPDHWAIAEAADATYPFRLTTSPARAYLNSSFNETTSSRNKHGAPVVMIHPDDLLALGLADGDKVRIGSRVGEIAVAVPVDPGVERAGGDTRRHVEVRDAARCEGAADDDAVFVVGTAAVGGIACREIVAQRGVVLREADGVTHWCSHILAYLSEAE